MSRSRELAELATAYDSGGSFAFRNRIINGQMMIDQRNAGSSVASSNSGPFVTDRWSMRHNTGGGEFTGQQVAAPTGSKFTKALKLTVTTADASIAAGEYYVLRTRIEGFNVADLQWGTASAAPITISFEVNASVAGTYSFAVCNSSNNRSYVSTFTVNAINTTETKTVTIAGDTSGTWLTDSGVGIDFLFNIGMGSTYTTSSTGSWQGATYYAATGQTQLISTLNATFYITGVQLEKGSTATSFDYRPYGTELALCQRYLPAWSTTTSSYFANGQCYSNTSAVFTLFNPVQTRVPVTGITTSGTFQVLNYLGTGLSLTSLSFNAANTSTTAVAATASSAGLTAGNCSSLFGSGSNLLLGTGCEL